MPAVAQEAVSGRVLTLAWMNREALKRTVETGEVHYWSRSRKKIWHKGEESGHVQKVLGIRLDCDEDVILLAHGGVYADCDVDTLVVQVHQEGVACHTGARTCFFSGDLEPAAPHEVLPALERTLAARQAERPEGSYTVALLDDPAHIGEKVEEEAEEVARAAREETDDRVDSEAADVLYHLLVLLRSRGRTLANVADVLRTRGAIGERRDGGAP